jgi:hypothetical protein
LIIMAVVTPGGTAARRPRRLSKFGGMTGDVMVGFGAKQAWLAVRGRAPEVVLAGLGLRDLGPVEWRPGIDLTYFSDDRVAVTPPLPGRDGHEWVLVPGRHWFHPWARPDVEALSDLLDTEVQFFASYRVTETHRWERAVGGVYVRGFEFVGEDGTVTLWRGDPDGTERGIGLPEQAPVGEETSLLVDEDDVMRIAVAWSLDPTALDGRPAPGPLRSAAVDNGAED